MKKEQKVSFSPERFKEAMAAAGKTQAALAREVGVSPKTIRRYMDGAPIIQRAVRADIASILDVNILWLTGNDVPMERTYVQKHLDKVKANANVLAKDDLLFNIVAALAEAPEKDRREIAQLLGTPADMAPIEVKHCKAKK